MRDMTDNFELQISQLPLKAHGAYTVAASYSDRGSGSSTGFGNVSTYSAIGETLERQYLHNEFLPDGFLSCKGFRKNREKDFLNTMVEVSQPINDLSSQIPYSFCFNLFDKKKIKIPSCFIDLSNEINQPEDHQIFIDSCGAALGSSNTQALQSGLFEFCERQALIWFWNNKTCIYKCDFSEVLEYAPSYLRTLVDDLQNTGVLTFYLTSLPFLNIHSGVLTYETDKVNKTCQFMVSMAANIDFHGLIEKLILELWQSYIFLMYQTQTNSDLKDAYKQEYVLANKPNTINLFQNFTVLKNKLDTRTYTLDELLHSLQKFSKNIYFYEKKIKYGFYFVKILSSDFFIHMHPHRRLNLSNKFAKKMKIYSLRNDQFPFP